jgi:phosphopantothenoylcysteine decarboxylase/phosphopantothenate--cysteine ligase
LQGLHVVVSAGGTREYLDPVRFLGNRSSGKQGVALAQRAAARGAHVTLVAANLEVPIPVGVDVVRVETSEQMLVAMSDAAPTGDIVVMAAAVADYAPVASAPEKIKKSGVAPIVELRETTDILAHLSARRRPGQTVVGFAAETGDATGTVLEHGLAKLARKGCDALVVNDVRGDRAFGSDDNEVTIVSASGQIHVSRRPKDQIADAIWDALLAQRQQ